MQECLCHPACWRQPRRAVSMAAMSIFFIGIIASKARFASPAGGATFLSVFSTIDINPRG